MNPIETDRLVLRLVDFNDAEAVTLLCNDYAITSMNLTIPYPCTINDTINWLNTQKMLYLRGLQINFAITLKTNGTIVGVIGFDIERPHERAKLGYWIGRIYWNNGYATEACHAMVKYIFMQLKMHRIYATTLGENTSSIRVLQKIGMQFEGTLREHAKKDGLFKDINNYGMLCDDYTFKDLHHTQDAAR
jgi:[ribosomal protein S5]-alanine N-acetyltransferase